MCTCKLHTLCGILFITASQLPTKTVTIQNKSLMTNLVTSSANRFTNVLTADSQLRPLVQSKAGVTTSKCYTVGKTLTFCAYCISYSNGIGLMPYGVDFI